MTAPVEERQRRQCQVFRETFTDQNAEAQQLVNSEWCVDESNEMSNGGAIPSTPPPPYSSPQNSERGGMGIGGEENGRGEMETDGEMRGEMDPERRVMDPGRREVGLDATNEGVVNDRERQDLRRRDEGVGRRDESGDGRREDGRLSERVGVENVEESGEIENESSRDESRRRGRLTKEATRKTRNVEGSTNRLVARDVAEEMAETKNDDRPSSSTVDPTRMTGGGTSRNTRGKESEGNVDDAPPGAAGKPPPMTAAAANDRGGSSGDEAGGVGTRNERRVRRAEEGRVKDKVAEKADDVKNNFERTMTLRRTRGTNRGIEAKRREKNGTGADDKKGPNEGNAMENKTKEKISRDNNDNNNKNNNNNNNNKRPKFPWILGRGKSFVVEAKKEGVGSKNRVGEVAKKQTTTTTTLQDRRDNNDKIESSPNEVVVPSAPSNSSLGRNKNKMKEIKLWRTDTISTAGSTGSRWSNQFEEEVEDEEEANRFPNNNNEMDKETKKKRKVTTTTSSSNTARELERIIVENIAEAKEQQKMREKYNSMGRRFLATNNKLYPANGIISGQFQRRRGHHPQRRTRGERFADVERGRYHPRRLTNPEGGDPREAEKGDPVLPGRGYVVSGGRGLEGPMTPSDLRKKRRESSIKIEKRKRNTTVAVAETTII